MQAKAVWILSAALLLVGFVVGYRIAHAEARPSCVDVHGSAIEAAKAQMDGKRVCEGTR